MIWKDSSAVSIASRALYSPFDLMKTHHNGDVGLIHIGRVISFVLETSSGRIDRSE